MTLPSIHRMPQSRTAVTRGWRWAVAHTSLSIRWCSSLTNFSLSGSRRRLSAQSCARDVFLLGFVQFAAIRDMRGDQLAHFLRRQWSGIVRLVEKVVHALIPEQPWIRLAHDFIEARFGVLGRNLLVLQQHRVLDRTAALPRERARAVAESNL
jgi:hypothetical protein